MKGTRPLSTEEIIAVSNQFDGMYEVRNRSLFMLGVSVGGRISELLALKVDDVWQNGGAVSDLLFQKDIVKGKETARMIPCNEDGRKAISELIAWHKEQFFNLDPKRSLFISRQGGDAISRSQAHRILERAFQKAGLNGKLATHSLRKTFAQRCYDVCENIYKVSELLGHKNVETTKRYIGISYTELQATVWAIELNQSRKTLHSIKRGRLYGFAAKPCATALSTEKFSTGDLLSELMARGYDVSSIGYQLQDERVPKRIAVAGGGKVVTFFPKRE